MRLTLSTRLALLYGILTLIVLSVCGILVYNLFRTELGKRTDILLATRAEGVLESVETLMSTERSRSGGEIAADDFQKIGVSWVEDMLSSLRGLGIVVVISTPDLKQFVATRNVLRPFLPAGFKPPLPHREWYAWIEVQEGTPNPIRMRVFSLPVVRGGQVAYLIQTAAPQDRIDAEIGALVSVLLLALPIGLSLVLVGGFFLSRPALIPIRRMAAMMERIEATSLNERVPTSNRRDEVSRLATTFNQMLDRLARAISEQRGFIEDLSHQLKTPLAVLRGVLETALLRQYDGEVYRERIADGLEEIDSLSRLVDRFLWIAKFDNHAMSLNRQAIDLAALLEKLTEDVAVLGQERLIRIRLEAHLPENVAIDRIQLTMALMNILENAVRYTTPEDLILVTAEADAQAVRITIRDHGPGFPSELMSQQLVRFRRAGTAQPTGHGLGLAIAERIIQLHGGGLRIENPKDGGCQVSIVLPID